MREQAVCALRLYGLTLEPLDVAPATGNLDPMHDPMARLREMECLEELGARAYGADHTPDRP